MTEQFLKNILTQELFGTRVCENTEDIQLVNLFYHELLLEKLLYGEPISVPELRKLLRKKIVNFEFIKLNGEVRPAKGTTMMKYIPPKDHPKGIRPSSPKVATFFDLDKDAWRSVSKRSKELVLKKDEETDKPIVVVRDKSKVKVKPITKYRISKDEIEQGETYKYTTNKGTNTYVEIIRELPNGEFQVSSPLFKTTFAVDKAKIGDKFTPPPDDVDVKDVEPTPVTPPQSDIKTKEEKPLRRAVDVPKEEEPEDVEVKGTEPAPTPPQPTEPAPEKTVIIPKQVMQPEPEEEDPTKAPPADITPPTPGEEEEGPEELKR